MTSVSQTPDIMTTTEADSVEDPRVMTTLTVIEWFIMITAAFGNTMLFILMRSKKMSKHSFSIYFSFSAVFNTLTITWNTIQDTYKLVNDIELEEDASVSYTFQCGFLEEFDGWFPLVSAWMMVCLCVDRYVSICHPIAAQTFCRRPIALFVSISVVVASFIIELPWPLVVPDRTDNDDAGGPALCGDEADNNLKGWDIVEVFISLFIPVITVLVLNSLILVRLNKKKAFRDESSLTEYGRGQNLLNRLNVSIFYLLVCNTVTWLPFSIVVFIDTVDPTYGDNDPQTRLGLSYTWHASLLIWLLTFAQDFDVLMLMSPVYRKEMRLQCACLLLCRKVDHERLDADVDIENDQDTRTREML